MIIAITDWAVLKGGNGSDLINESRLPRNNEISSESKQNRVNWKIMVALEFLGECVKLKWYYSRKDCNNAVNDLFTFFSSETLISNRILIAEPWTLFMLIWNSWSCSRFPMLLNNIILIITNDAHKSLFYCRWKLTEMCVSI